MGGKALIAVEALNVFHGPSEEARYVAQVKAADDEEVALGHNGASTVAVKVHRGRTLPGGSVKPLARARAAAAADVEVTAEDGRGGFHSPRHQGLHIHPPAVLEALDGEKAHGAVPAAQGVEEAVVADGTCRVLSAPQARALRPGEPIVAIDGAPADVIAETAEDVEVAVVRGDGVELPGGGEGGAGAHQERAVEDGYVGEGVRQLESSDNVGLSKRR